MKKEKKYEEKPEWAFGKKRAAKELAAFPQKPEWEVNVFYIHTFILRHFSFRYLHMMWLWGNIHKHLKKERDFFHLFNEIKTRKDGKKFSWKIWHSRKRQKASIWNLQWGKNNCRINQRHKHAPIFSISLFFFWIWIYIKMWKSLIKFDSALNSIQMSFVSSWKCFVKAAL